MKCLCCGREVPNNESWHKSCIKKFFGTTSLPTLELNNEVIEVIARKNISEGFTVAGVQKKMSLHLSKAKESKLTLVDYPLGYILKPEVSEYKHLPANEHLTMLMAGITGIDVVNHALVEVNNEYAYLTKRIDRVDDEKVAMEDFCQLSNKLTEYKYQGSYELCAKIIKQYSSRKLLDITELFIRVVFCFITGNSDMHLKNFSLIEDNPGSNTYHLASAYDLLSVKLVMKDNDDLALTLNGKKRNLRRSDFIKFGLAIGLSNKQINDMMDKVLSLKDKYEALIDESYLDSEEKEKYKLLVETNIERIS